MCLMAATRNLLVLFVAMQLAWLPCCVLAAFRRDHAAGSLGAMKLILFAAAAAAVTLYGMSLLYGLFGTLDAGQIGELLGQGQWHDRLGGASGMVLALALMLTILGMGTMAAAAPACFWMPEVFEAANMDVAAFLSVAPVIAGLAALLRILSAMAGSAGSAAALGWLPFALAAIGALTCLCGAIGALSQTNIKRLLAWSGIAHGGFMLIGMAAVVSHGNAAGVGQGRAALTGDLASPAAAMLLFYLLMYVFMNGGAMIAAAAIAQRLTGPFDAGMSLGVDKIISAAAPRKAARETGEEIGQYAGLSRRAPILSAVMLVFLLSLAGVPLTAGFAAKIKLLGVLFDLPEPLSWVAVGVVGVGTVLLAFSYFRVVRQMYLVESEAPRLIEIAPVTVVALVLVIPSVALFVGYGVVDRLAAGQARMVLPAAQVGGR
jgi:NADH-quinone oxidoreductase subunit N